MKNRRRLGAYSPPKPYEPPERPEGKINVSDPDSRDVKTPRGWVRGYNAQAVTTEDQIVIAAEVHVSSADVGQLGPMVAAARDELARAGVEQSPEVVLADAGYWHRVQMERLAAEGVTPHVPPDANKRAGARPGWEGGLYTFMRRVLATDHRGALYARRKAMIEPVFADTKFNRRVDRFLRRGRAAARSEWRAHRRRPQPPQALAAHLSARDGLRVADRGLRLATDRSSAPARRRAATDFPQQPPCIAIVRRLRKAPSRFRSGGLVAFSYL
jgi:hypothetical protein